MKYYRSVTLVVYFLAAILFLSTPAMAAKAKFERTKPHVNVGTIAKQEPRVLVHNLTPPAASEHACWFSGRLIATDITPDSALPVEEVVFAVENLEIPAGRSVAIPIALEDLDPPMPDVMRRELDVEIQANEDFNGPCALMMAAAGYDTYNQATEYYIESVIHHISPAPHDGAEPGAKPVFAFPIGFVGGNGDQFIRFIFTSYETPAGRNGQGVQCDLSGALRLQTVPLLGSSDPVVEKTYPVQLQQGRLSLDSDPNDFGADPWTRVDLIAIYETNPPPEAGVCANAIGIGMQTIDSETGETAAAGRPKPFFSNYRPRFYFR